MLSLMSAAAAQWQKSRYYQTTFQTLQIKTVFLLIYTHANLFIMEFNMLCLFAYYVLNCSYYTINKPNITKPG